MVICALKLHCDGVERSALLDTDGLTHRKNLVASLDDLCAYLAAQYEVSHFRLTYLDDNDRACRIRDDDGLYHAARLAPRGLLHVKVTSSVHGYDDTDYLVYESKPIVKRSKDALARRFAVHDRECCYCNKSPIQGVCHVYRHDDAYALCDGCSSNYDRDGWLVTRFPWKKDVPTAPLSSADSTVMDGVRHLQMTLTELGYMKLSHTDKYQGSFQVHTANAVKAFRVKYGVRGADMTVYDKATARQLADVLRRV